MKRSTITRLKASVFYLIFAVLVTVCMWDQFDPSITIDPLLRMILVGVGCSSLLWGSRLIKQTVSGGKAKERINYITFFLLFIVYCVYLTSLLFFDTAFSRSEAALIRKEQGFRHYFRQNTNLKPLATIQLFLNAVNSGTLSWKVIAVNLAGNVMAFMPFGVFIPVLFQKLNTFPRFFLLMILMICGIEITQFFTFTGSADVDDLILNLFGATFTYLFMRLFFPGKRR